MSGEMNTSLGNGWANYILFSYIVQGKGGEWEGFVEGDDGIFCSSVPVETSDYNRLGFDVKIEEVDNISEASFCGIISAPDGTLLKDPRRVLQTFGWTHSFIHAGDEVMDELLRAKALSLCYEAPQCPILGVLARSALAFTEGVTPRFVQDGYHDYSMLGDFEIPEFNPSSQARSTFASINWAKEGEAPLFISIPLQKQIEEALIKGDMDFVARALPAPRAVQDYCLRYIEPG